LKLPWQRKGIKLTSAERLARQVGKNRRGEKEKRKLKNTRIYRGKKNRNNRSTVAARSSLSLYKLCQEEEEGFRSSFSRP
jgi:hypothetical protein